LVGNGEEPEIKEKRQNVELGVTEVIRHSLVD
jgi:hypothetical protein